MKLRNLAILVLFVGIVSSSGNPQATAKAPNSVADEKAIQAVIVRSFELEAAAARTFDTAAFSDVFVNDPRGGELSKSTLEFILSVEPTLELTTAGYLDYKLAYFKWWKQGAEKLEALQATAANEWRALTDSESRSLIDSSGRIAMPRSEMPAQDPNLDFVSIDVKGDVAVVVFVDGAHTNEMTLVRIKRQWLIAGNQFLAIHP